MADGENFGKLVSGLSLNERQNLLERLKSQSNISKEPLYSEDEKSVPAYDLATEFPSLPWYYRLWFFILSIIKSKPPVRIFEENRVAGLGIKIDERAPGLYDYQKGMLMPSFYRQIQRLKEGAHFFYSALDSSVNRDKSAFFAFLGSLEMPDVHSRLQEETSPAFFADKFPDIQEMEVRQKAYKAMEDAFGMITDEYRNTMYFNARTLNCLKELSSFLYDRLLRAFNVDTAVGGETCSAAVVRELLVSLNNNLFSLKIIPPMTLLESLFVFILQDRVGDPAFDISRETALLLSKAETSLAVIRKFNKQVPLTWILRCSTRDMSLAPREISGGEDWYAIYRDYWKRRVDALFADYLKERRQRELLSSFRFFLKGKSLKKLENIQSEKNQDGLPVREAFTFSFLSTFYSEVFIPDINWTLRAILINGEFRLKENRAEFAESYNILMKLEENINRFDLEISPAGDYGKRYIQAKQDMSSLPLKRRRIQIVIEDVEEDVKRILEPARRSLDSMVNVLGGIIVKDPSGKYDTLANLAKFTAKDSQFLAGLGEIIQKFQTVLKLLNDIEVMEYSK
jgi:hypothetical protein